MEEAVKLCSQAIKDFASNKPVEVLALRMRARAYVDIKDYEKARRDLDRVIGSGMAMAEDYWLRGIAYSWLNKLDLSLKDHETANRLVPDNDIFINDLGTTQAYAGRHGDAELTFTKLVEKYPKEPSYRAQRGWSYFKAGKHELALRDYDQAISADPNNAATWFERGTVHEDFGNETAAEKDYGKAVLLKPNDATYLAAHGRLLFYTGYPVLALQELSQSIEKNAFASTYIERAGLHLGEGRIDDAVKDIELAAQLKTRPGAVAMMRGRVLAARGDYGAAIAAYKRAVKLEPDYAVPVYWRAVAWHEKGELKKAYKDYTTLFSAWPRDEVVRHERGNVLFDLGRIEEALADYNEALELDPNYASALESRARLHNYEGRWQAAIDDTDAALKINPDRPIAYHRRAYANWGLGKLEAAARDYGEAIRLAPDLTYAYSERASVLIELERFDEAHRDIDKAIELQPNSAELRRRRASVFEAQTKFAEAKAAYQDAIDLAPDDGWGYEGRAWANLYLRNLVAAMADCNLAIKKLPKEPATYRCRARVKYESGNQAGALRDLTKAHAMASAYGAAYYDKGHIFLKQGQYEEARDNFSRAIALNYRKAQSLMFRGDALRAMNLRSQALADYRSAEAFAYRNLGPTLARRISGLGAGVENVFDNDTDYPQRHSAGPRQ
jgi:tetratricopeptide (TPR) repeat protein